MVRASHPERNANLSGRQLHSAGLPPGRQGPLRRDGQPEEGVREAEGPRGAAQRNRDPADAAVQAAAGRSDSHPLAGQVAEGTDLLRGDKV